MNIMNKTIVLGVVLALIFLAGCQSAADKAAEKNAENQIKAETGGNANVDIDSSEGRMNIETDNGSVEINTNMKDVKEGDWCPEGGEWTMAASGTQGDTSAEWNIDRIMTSGEFAGLCHVVFTTQGPNGEMNVDYYFNENGESGYMVMNQNGQTIKQEWHK